MFDAGELQIAILALVALGQTFYLRRELEEHGLHMWVYAAFPLLTITTLILVMWHELPSSVIETLAYAFGTLTVVAFFLGALIAYRRR